MKKSLTLSYFFILYFLTSQIFFSFAQAPKNYPKGTFHQSIKNTFLVATTKMKDPRFKQTVIVVMENNQEGSVGFVINKPIGLISIKHFKGYKEYLKDKKQTSDLNIPTFWGGPVEEDKVFIIHSTEYKSNSTKSYKDISISNDIGVLFDIAEKKGPKRSLVVLGYSGWASGQLEGEMEMDEWVLSDMDLNLIFNNEKTNKWIQAYENSFLRL